MATKATRVQMMMAMVIVGAMATCSNAVAVGAIRWDAWYGAEDDVGAYVQSALSPEVRHGTVSTQK